MKESGQDLSKQGRSNQILVTVMILLLMVIAGMQAWYIVGIKKQLNAIQSDLSSSPAPQLETTEKTEQAVASENTPPQPELEIASDQQQHVEQQAPPIDKTVNTENWPALPDNTFSRPPYYAHTWDPYQEIERMQRQMERAFKNPYNHYNRPGFRYQFRQDISAPKMDVREDYNQYTVFVNIPGADAKSLSVNLDGQRLSVQGKQSYEKQDRDRSGRIIFRERRSGKFQRSITLPEPVKQKGMQTRIANGVLTITIPKMK